MSLPPGWDRHVRTCPGCGRPVLWAVTVRGKRQALDPAVDERGNTAVHRDGSGTLRARGITKERPTPDTFERLFVPHAATCPGRQPGPGYPPGPLRQPVPATLPDNVIPFDRARRRRATRRP